MTYAAAFNELRALAGYPTLRCIQARTAWTIPSGYSYSADYDRYVNSGGTVWTPVTADLPYTDVDILPSSGAEIVQFVAGGLLDAGDRMVRILPGSKTTVEAAPFFVLDSVEMVLSEVTGFPAGNPMWYSVRLRKR